MDIIVFFRYVAIVIVGYFLGNFSTGMLVGRRIAKIDIRQHGSGNAGTTNILRTLGWLPSVLTLIGDVIKAVLASLLGLWLQGTIGAMIGGTCAVIGHNWPVLFSFKGGKGMAASFGVLLVVDPVIALIMLGVQLVVLLLTRYMSVASLVSVAVYPILTLIMRYGQWDLFAFSLVIMVLAVICHRENIRRLIGGTENRLDFSKIKKINTN